MSYRLDIEVDMSEVDQDLARIARGPTPFTEARFTGIIDRQFMATQAAVHRITGSLAATGDVDSGDFLGGWRGQISYGGEEYRRMVVPGPPRARHPGFYAEFEFDRGGDHNWMYAADLEGSEDDYAEAVTDWMRDET
jgi:hypothetical protein